MRTPAGTVDRRRSGHSGYSARELLALSAWKQGDIGAARQWTEMIIGDPQTPAGARSRAEVLSELIAAGGKG